MDKKLNLTEECLQKWATDPKSKTKPAFTFINDSTSNTWSYEELWNILLTYSRNINKLIPEKHSKILIRLPHSAEYAFCFFASILVDKIFFAL